MRRKGFYIPAGTRLVSAKPAFDWDRYLAEARTKREAREAALAGAETLSDIECDHGRDPDEDYDCEEEGWEGGQEETNQ